MITKLLKLSALSAVLFFGNTQKADACHAIALVNFNQQIVGPNDIQVTAASNSPTCGCSAYWLDLEVRCLNEPFDAAPFNPGFWGPLATYPYFQSAQMNKPSCVVQNYPWITIPFAGLCPGMTYQYRMRENHNGQVGPWCATQTFTVPGATGPIVAGAGASQTIICAGDCVNLTSSVVSGCGLAASYVWDNGAGSVQNPTNICPLVTTTYTVTITEQCSGFQDQASVTVQVTPPPVTGVASITTPNPICSGDPVNLDMVGHQGLVQWQSAPNAGGPWTNIAGATTVPYNIPSVMADQCYRAEISGCGGAVVYSNVVCVTVDAAPTANFTFVPVCGGMPTVFTDQSNTNGGSAITTWLWDFDDGGATSNQQNPTHTYPGAGPYNVSLTVTNATGCSNTVVIPVNGAASPTANFNVTLGCEGQITGFTDASTPNGSTINSWTWDFGDTQTSGAQNPNNTYAAPGPYNVTLTIGTTGGCTDQVIIPITVPDNPAVAFNMQNVCDGVPGNFLDASTVTTGVINQWQWDMESDATVDYTTQNVTHSYPASSTYNVTLTVTSDQGCTNTLTQPVTIFPNPITDFTPTTVCQGNPSTFTDLTNPNGGTLNTWNWDIGDDGSVEYNTQNPTHTFPAPGLYDVELMVNTVNGCADSVVLQVTVDPQPTAAFTVTNVCDGNGVTLTDNSVPGGSPITGWEWDVDNNGVVDYTTQNATHTYGTEGVYTVQLVVQGTGCSDTLTQTVDVYPNPVAAFTPQSVCLNVPANFGDNSTVSNANTVNNIIQWDWDFDGDMVIDFSGQNPPTQTYGTAGQYNITLTVTTDNGCTHTTTVPMDVYDQPVANFAFTDDCVDQNANFLDGTTITAPAVVNTWNWDVDGDGVTDYNTQNPSHLYANPGTYNVTLIAGSASGCMDTITQVITRYAIPVVSFTAPPECEYDCVQFTSGSSVGAPSVIASEVWDFGDNSGLSAAPNPCHMYAQEGTYNVTLIITSDHGCVNSTIETVDVFPQPVASFTATTVCENEPPTTFTNTSSIPTGAISSYSWDFGDFNNTSVPSPTHVYGGPNTYNVVLIATSDFGCTDTVTAPVDVYAMPTANFNATQTEGCPDFCPVFADQSNPNAGSITNWVWDLGNGQTSNAQSPTACYPNSSNTADAMYDVQLIVTNDLGCSDTLLLSNYIIAHPNPIADFTAEPEETNEYDPIIDFTNFSIGGTTYDWDFGNGDPSNEEHPSHFYTDTGTFDVTLVTTTAFGCTASVTHPVTIIPVPSIYVPNTFTPDGDGKNDIFLPQLYAHQNSQYELYIFDRWGQVVFESFSQNVGWDGSIKGGVDNSKTDVFVWKIILRAPGSGDKKEYVGHVTLLK